MYKTKPCHDCDMPAPGMPLRVLVLNGSLKHGDNLSNTAVRSTTRWRAW
ncbi:MAG: hypothetical protein ACR2HK_13525 [Gemmatimonadales bacterium]